MQFNFLIKLFLILLFTSVSSYSFNLKNAANEFPKTDFDKKTINLNEIKSGGPPRDGIPPIDNPKFAKEDKDIQYNEPVIYLEINQEAKIYPIRVLTWHEIVNDTIGTIPVSVTYCPLCNASIVFDRRFADIVLDFGTTGRLRKSDLVMYDRQTETWWQQFTGEGIVGEFSGKELKKIPSMLISYGEALKMIKDQNLKVQILKGNGARAYGSNPYVGYDQSSYPFLYDGTLPADINPMEYVIVVENNAYTLQSISNKKEVIIKDIKITWKEGLSSALENNKISNGRDLGFVRVQKLIKGKYEDIVYDYTFAFVYHAFHNGGKIINVDT